MYPSELDRAWVAGFFDGEGCIFVARSRHKGMKHGVHYRVSASISLTHLPTLERLQSLFGGNIHRNNWLSKVPGRKSIWQWVLSGAGTVQTFLRSIRPFSVTKLEEVELGIEACQNWDTGRNLGRQSLSWETLALREGYYLALQEAKHGVS